MVKKIGGLIVLYAVQFIVWAGSAECCAVCFGNKDSTMTQGMNAGILSLLGVLVCVLLSFAAFFLYLWWRVSHPLVEGLAVE